MMPSWLILPIAFVLFLLMVVGIAVRARRGGPARSALAFQPDPNVAFPVIVLVVAVSATSGYVISVGGLQNPGKAPVPVMATMVPATPQTATGATVIIAAATRTPSATPTKTATRTATRTPEPPTATATATATPTDTPSPTLTETAEPLTPTTTPEPTAAPTETPTTTPEPTPTAGPEPTAVATPLTCIHVVSWGERLWDIAQRYGVNHSEMARLNGIRPTRIFPGQQLRIPQPGC